MGWLKGKKTYITMILSGLTGLALLVGWIDEEMVLKINAILIPLGLGFMRKGVAKNGP